MLETPPKVQMLDRKVRNNFDGGLAYGQTAMPAPPSFAGRAGNSWGQSAGNQSLYNLSFYFGLPFDLHEFLSII